MATKLGIIQFIKKVEQGDVATVRDQIRQYGLPKGGTVNTDYTALQGAIRFHRYEIAKLLISCGCRINPRASDNGQTPLAMAVEQQNVQMVQLLLEKKATIVCNDTYRANTSTILHLAVEKKLYSMLQLILAYNININITDSSGKTALQRMIIRFNAKWNPPSPTSADLQMIEFLLSKGAIISFNNNDGVYPLHFAAKLKNMEILQKFVQACPDVNITDAEGNTVLHILVSMTSINSQSKVSAIEIVKMLIQKGAKASIVNNCKESVSHLAAKHKKLSIMKIIPHNQNSLNQIDSQGNTVFHRLLENSLSLANNQEFLNVFMLLLSLGIVIDQKNSDGKTPLHVAAENRQDQVLRVLLPCTNNVDTRDNLDNSLLQSYLQSIINHGSTSWENNYTIVKILLDKGIAVDAKNEQGIAPIHLALKLRNRDIVMKLLECINNADLCDNKGRSLLHFFAANKYKSRSTSNSPDNLQESVEIAKKILAKNATIDLRDNRQRTPLHVAVTSRQSVLVQLLLERGADPNAVDEQGDNALQFLVNSRRDQTEDVDISIAEMLISKGANLEVVNKQNLSVLHIVAYNQRLKLMMAILEHCSKKVVELKDLQGNTALHMLIKYNKPRNDAAVPNLCIEITMQFLSKIGNTLINEPNEAGETLLHLATREKHDEILQVLLLNGADPLTCDHKGNTVLHLIASSKPMEGENPSNVEEQIIEMLVQKGCPIDALNQDGWTPLHVAAKCGNDKIVASLIAHGAEVHCTVGEHSSTALHLSADCNNIQVAKTLLLNGLDVNAMRSDGKTCLHLAAMHESFEMIKLLLENRADPDVQDSFGNTALHVACWNDNFESANKLLEYGADMNIVNSVGSTALLLSQSSDDSLITKLAHHANKLRVANLPLALKNSEYIKSLRGLDLTPSSNYDEELLEMERYLVDAQTTVADVLRMSASRLVIYKANHKFRKLIFESEEFAQKFPHYVDIIRANYRKGIVRSELECSAKKAFNLLCRFVWPDICCEKILRNLNNEQLRTLINTSKLKVDNKKRFLKEMDEELNRPAKRARRISV